MAANSRRRYNSLRENTNKRDTSTDPLTATNNRLTLKQPSSNTPSVTSPLRRQRQLNLLKQTSSPPRNNNNNNNNVELMEEKKDESIEKKSLLVSHTNLGRHNRRDRVSLLREEGDDKKNAALKQQQTATRLTPIDDKRESSPSSEFNNYNEHRMAKSFSTAKTPIIQNRKTASSLNSSRPNSLFKQQPQLTTTSPSNNNSNFASSQSSNSILKHSTQSSSTLSSHRDTGATRSPDRQLSAAQKQSPQTLTSKSISSPSTATTTTTETTNNATTTNTPPRETLRERMKRQKQWSQFQQQKHSPDRNNNNKEQELSTLSPVHHHQNHSQQRLHYGVHSSSPLQHQHVLLGGGGMPQISNRPIHTIDSPSNYHNTANNSTITINDSIPTSLLVTQNHSSFTTNPSTLTVSIDCNSTIATNASSKQSPIQEHLNEGKISQFAFDEEDDEEEDDEEFVDDETAFDSIVEESSSSNVPRSIARKQRSRRHRRLHSNGSCSTNTSSRGGLMSNTKAYMMQIVENKQTQSPPSSPRALSPIRSIKSPPTSPRSTSSATKNSATGSLLEPTSSFNSSSVFIKDNDGGSSISGYNGKHATTPTSSSLLRRNVENNSVDNNNGNASLASTNSTNTTYGDNKETAQQSSSSPPWNEKEEEQNSTISPSSRFLTGDNFTSNNLCSTSNTNSRNISSSCTNNSLSQTNNHHYNNTMNNNMHLSPSLPIRQRNNNNAFTHNSSSPYGNTNGSALNINQMQNISPQNKSKNKEQVGQEQQPAWVPEGDDEGHRSGFNKPGVTAAVGITAAAAAGGVVLGPVGLLVGVALVGLGLSLSQIPEEQADDLCNRATSMLQCVQDKTMAVNDSIQSSCLGVCESSGLAKQYPDLTKACCSGGRQHGGNGMDVSGGERDLNVELHKGGSLVGDSGGVVGGITNANPASAAMSYGNGYSSVTRTINEDGQVVVRKNGDGNMMDQQQNFGGAAMATNIHRDFVAATADESAGTRMVTCLKKVWITPVGQIHSLEPSRQPRAWLEVVASALSSEDDKNEAMEEILIFAKDKFHAQIFLQMGILDSLMYIISSFFKNYAADAYDDFELPKPLYHAKLAATCCVALGKGHCAIVHTEGDLLLMSSYNRGTVPIERQVAQMLYEVPYHRQIAGPLPSVDKETIIRYVEEKVFVLAKLTMSESEELARSVKCLADGTILPYEVSNKTKTST